MIEELLRTDSLCDCGKAVGPKGRDVARWLSTADRVRDHVAEPDLDGDRVATARHAVDVQPDIWMDARALKRVLHERS